MQFHLVDKQVLLLVYIVEATLMGSRDYIVLNIYLDRKQIGCMQKGGLDTSRILVIHIHFEFEGTLDKLYILLYMDQVHLVVMVAVEEIVVEDIVVEDMAVEDMTVEDIEDMVVVDIADIVVGDSLNIAVHLLALLDIVRFVGILVDIVVVVVAAVLQMSQYVELEAHLDKLNIAFILI